MCVGDVGERSVTEKPAAANIAAGNVGSTYRSCSLLSSDHFFSPLLFVAESFFSWLGDGCDSPVHHLCLCASSLLNRISLREHRRVRLEVIQEEVKKIISQSFATCFVRRTECGRRTR